MFTRTTTTRTLAALLAAVFAGSAFAGANVATEYQRFADEKSPALVTLKFVLKVKIPGYGEQEAESEATAVMIDASGLMLCSNTPLGGFVAALKAQNPAAADMTATPTDIKVLIGDDTEGMAATLLTVDSERDLAWLKIKEPGERAFSFVDFSKSAVPAMGDRLLLVRRMGEYFDRIPAVAEERVSAITTKPRKLYVPAVGGFASTIGLPVYNERGEVLGLTVMQSMDEEDVAANPSGSGSQMADMQDLASGLILPAAEIVRATELAKKVEPIAEEPKTEEKPEERPEEAKATPEPGA